MPTFTAGELAERVAGDLEGDPDRRVSGVAPVERAGPEDLTFVTGEPYVRRLADASPAAVLLPRELDLSTDPDGAAPGNGPGPATLIRVADPQLALARILPLFFPEPDDVPAGVDESAIVGPGAELGSGIRVGPGVVIGEGAALGEESRVGPFTVIGEGVRVGRRCRIGSHCSLQAGVRVGDRVRLHAGVRLGTEGFGYARGPEGPVKIPQVGGCIVEDDVEIGANSTVDRGTLGDTVIGRGTVIDNLVHIGHNVEIGEGCTIVAQVGIAGSVRIGDGAVLAGQAGIADHLTIGPGARIGAQAGVIGDVPADADYSGYPARPHQEAMRASAALFRLPDLLRRLRALERRLDPGDGGAGAGEEGPAAGEVTGPRKREGRREE